MIQEKTNLTPLASSLQSAEIDRFAQADYNLSAELLMETAGAFSAQEVATCVDRFFGKNLNSQVMILCGPGNNGGDGLVMARHLLSEGISVKIFLSQVPTSQLVEKQKKRLSALGISFYPLEDLQKVKHISEKCSLIVDALFGVGLSRNIEGMYAHLVQWINSTGKTVISLDTPSGLDVDTGQVRGQAVKAQFTFSFGLAKPGFYLMHGPEHVGFLKLFSIGYPLKLLVKKANTCFLVNKSWVSSRLVERKPTDHKARQGHLLVLAGSSGKWGASVLTALSAYRMGAGYVTCSAGSLDIIKNIPDVLTQDLSDPDLFKNKTAVAIGPGFGTGESTKKLLLKLKNTKLPVVVDADAWTVCVREKLFPLPSHWALTPHSGELARLFGITGEEVDQDRLAYVVKASQKTACFVLLKGFHSVIAQKDKSWIIPTGHSALAKAGTGDVLTGFIGALMARGLDTFSAVAVAGFIHGRLAEQWVNSGKDKDCLMAQDLKDILPVILKELRT